MARVAGKAVVVTGSGRHRGLGQGILQRFADEGAACVVSDVTIGDEAEEVAGELRRRGARVLTVACDVSDPAQCAALIASAAGASSKPAGCVPMAGSAATCSRPTRAAC